MLRLNDVKLSAWLRRKALALKTYLASDAATARDAAQRAADAHTSQFDDVVVGAPSAAPATDEQLAVAVALVAEYLDSPTQTVLCAACETAETAVEGLRGPEKRPPMLQANASQASTTSTASMGPSWATDVADADAEVSSSAGSGQKREAPAAPTASAEPEAKKTKPAFAPPKSKAEKTSAPLKKGQQTMMGFFKAK